VGPVKEWSEDIARQLREPLPDNQIGRLPKIPKNKQNDQRQSCNYCGGWHVPIPDRFHVPYIAHAIVTDKLNTIVGQDGWDYRIDVLRESKDGEHVIGILATLVIGGIEKQEGGDPGGRSTWGEELKLAISDWLPRAAMRFGLGLEAWAKQPLDRVIATDTHEDRQDRQDTGLAEGRRESRAPEAGATPPAPVSGSNGQLNLVKLNTAAKAKAYIQEQPEDWRAAFNQLATQAVESGEFKSASELQVLHRLIERTREQQQAGGGA